MTGLTYDTGALIAAERADISVWEFHEQAIAAGAIPTVPAGVLAQAWRGGPQALLSRLLAGCEIEPFDEPEARAAGSACAQAGTSDLVDAAVVVGASTRGDVIFTSDVGDLERIAASLGIGVRLHQV